MSENKYSIYRITNSINKKVYIGWTSRPLSDRWEDHIKKSRNSTQGHLYNAIRKHGIENFKLELIYQSWDRDYSLEMEAHFIKSHKASDRQNGYNCNTGGRQPKMSEETKKKISEGKKGSIFSEDARNRISKSLKRYHSKNKHPNKGRKTPEEQIERQRQKLIGTSWGNHTQEAKDKISDSKKGKKRGAEFSLTMITMGRKGKPIYDHGIPELILSLYDQGMGCPTIGKAIGAFFKKDIPDTQIRSVIKSLHRERELRTDIP